MSENESNQRNLLFFVRDGKMMSGHVIATRSPHVTAISFH